MSTKYPTGVIAQAQMAANQQAMAQHAASQPVQLSQQYNPNTWGNSPSTFTQAMTLDASGNLGIGSQLGRNAGSIQIGRVRISALIAEYLTLTVNPHPAFKDDMVGLLLEMADSPYEQDRIYALKRAEFPLARAVTMCNDHDEDVREAAEKVVAYAQQHPEIYKE